MKSRSIATTSLAICGQLGSFSRSRETFAGFCGFDRDDSVTLYWSPVPLLCCVPGADNDYC